MNRLTPYLISAVVTAYACTATPYSSPLRLTEQYMYRIFIGFISRNIMINILKV